MDRNEAINILINSLRIELTTKKVASKLSAL